MKLIGILGGMSAASTELYYRRLNEGARARLGGLHAANLLVRSFDFAEIEAFQAAGDWAGAGKFLHREAMALEAAGAELLILATNTMHRVAEETTVDLRIPFLHIADATAAALADAGMTRPGLIATAYTMEQEFYTGRLRDAGLDPVLPGEDDRALIQRTIYDELCKGVVTDESRETFEGIATRLAEAGADSLILGCTEVGMLLNDGNVSVPVFDTTHIHCDRALDLALQD